MPGGRKGFAQEIEERIEVLRDKRRKFSNRMDDALLKQDYERHNGWRAAIPLSEQIEHLIYCCGHAISDLDGAVVDQELVCPRPPGGLRR